LVLNACQALRLIYNKARKKCTRRRTNSRCLNRGQRQAAGFALENFNRLANAAIDDSLHGRVYRSNCVEKYRQGRMSKPYWRSATFRNFGVAVLILAALILSPLAAARLPADLIMGLPPTLLFFALGLPVLFLVLAIFKISLQQRLDRTYELDSEDQLQRRRVPKRLRAFPVTAREVPEADFPTPKPRPHDIGKAGSEGIGDSD
tara:strand:+ start:3693 stop:4304 length:612 start_codon:yes stop_codon:yes gene_type:complete